ncbi:hypothetical protein CI238_11589 [Colletotrichum incanum]|uniref:Uncharacterized protein n=1 Tax=Colletotrichum incanum TaxID=1573173 RepID=A0A166LV48_COLIC|nr:hypothetical protein CI238_11589 [Colletotrichum incanum]
MRLAAFATLFSTFLPSIVFGLALPWFNMNRATSGPAAAVGEEERQNSKFPKEMDFMEEFVRRAGRHCLGAHGEDKNECYWKLRGAWPGYPDDYPSSALRMLRSLGVEV